MAARGGPVLALLFGCLAAPGVSTAEGFRLEGSAELRQGWTAGGDLAVDEYRLRLRGRWLGPDGTELAASFAALDSGALESGRFSRAGIDEWQLARSFGPCKAALGARTVVWGQADRLRVIDVVNPLDLRESYFGDWSHKRLPVGMFDLECQDGEQAWQLIAVPSPRFDRLPAPGGRFSVPLPPAAPPAAQPQAGGPEDWSWGLQWSGRAGTADVTLNAYRGWDSGREADSRRFTLFGASFALPLGPLVLRGEAARRDRSRLVGASPAGWPQALWAPTASALLGVDYATGPWFVSVQYFGQEAEEAAAAPLRRQRLLTATVRRSLWQDRLTLGVYAAVDRERPARYLQAEASCEIAAHWLLVLAAERFSGAAASFGRFDGEDRYWASLRFLF